MGNPHALLRTGKYCSTLTVHTSFVIFIIDAEHGLNISIEFALSVFITDMSEKRQKDDEDTVLEAR